MVTWNKAAQRYYTREGLSAWEWLPSHYIKISVVLVLVMAWHFCWKIFELYCQMLLSFHSTIRDFESWCKYRCCDWHCTECIPAHFPSNNTNGEKFVTDSIVFVHASTFTHFLCSNHAGFWYCLAYWISRASISPLHLCQWSLNSNFFLIYFCTKSDHLCPVYC